MNINSFLESSSEGLIQLPWSIGSSHNQNTLLTVSATIHLNQELGLDSPRWLILTFGSLTAERINLIDKDHRWLPFSCELKKLLYQSFRLTLPFTHEIGRWDWEECAVTLGSTSLSEETLTRSWWAIQQYTCPWLTSTLEKLWEFNRHNDCFLKSFFGALKTSDIAPLNIWLFGNNGRTDRIIKLIFLFISLIAIFGPI